MRKPRAFTLERSAFLAAEKIAKHCQENGATGHQLRLLLIDAYHKHTRKMSWTTWRKGARKFFGRSLLKLRSIRGKKQTELFE